MPYRRAIFAILILLLSMAPAMAEEQDPPGPGHTASAITNTDHTRLSYPLLVSSIVYHGNVHTGKFHRPGCRYYDCKNCIREFYSRSDAINAGYIPCKVCRP